MTCSIYCLRPTRTKNKPRNGRTLGRGRVVVALVELASFETTTAAAAWTMTVRVEVEERPALSVTVPSLGW